MCLLKSLANGLDIVIPTNQKVTITIIHCSINHGRIAEIDVDCHSMSRSGISCTTNRMNTLHKIYRSLSAWYIKRHPSHLIRVGWNFVPIRCQTNRSVERHKRFVNHRWTNPIKPRSSIFRSRCRKCCARKLLSVQSICAFLWGILRCRYSVWIIGMDASKV